MNISVFLIILSFIFFFSLLFFSPYMKLGLSLTDWDFLSFKFNFYFNSILFSFILLVVTLSVLIFSTYYLNGELNFNYYYFVLLIFVGSMFSLNFSNSMFTMLVSWDILGISSFFLVLFYNNWDSCSGAMNTVLTNRLGDFFLFVFFSMGFFSSYFFLGLSFFIYMSGLMLILTAFTKSAQFPFSGWLPKAMSAPTPVSSLVHSSTLVTAGLILIMNFNEMVINSSLSGVILVTGIFTMFFSSVTALVEEDMKKVVALSTLSQMGFSMLTVGLGLSFISFTHLVSHALFKSCLFMQVGYLIHCSFGQQDGRSYSNLGGTPSFIQIQLLVTLFCLCGLVFSSGAVSKDFILELFFSNNFMALFSLMFFISVFLTFGYSYRLWKSFFLSFSSSVNHYSSGFVMNFLSLVLVIFSVIFLWWLNLNTMFLPSLFLYFDFFTPLMFIIFSVISFFIIVKFVMKELTFKFVVDLLPKLSIYLSVDMKFVDYLLNSFNSKGFTSFSVFTFLGGGFMKSLNYNSIVVIMALLLFII
uniref:NADH:ubiquinone reductase (H(+)-translocating) n=1 Tax=Steinernema litorale TaxID=361181 RepID=A0A1E1G7G1_9BILA|nr:NADH dehydrogenase subunit 5 [Steinernema litorale]